MIIFSARDPFTGLVITAPAKTDREAGDKLVEALREHADLHPSCTRLDWWEVNMGESAR